MSRFIEKPNISIIVKAPINDSGIATVGINTERIEPRKTNTTKVTMASASNRLQTTSRIELLTKEVAS